MKVLADSYRYCRRVSSKSGSNFYRSMGLLAGDRRRAMDALYAFARIADDVSDATVSFDSPAQSKWIPESWHSWVDELLISDDGGTNQVSELSPIRLAVADATRRFTIPLRVYHDLIEGMEHDRSESVRIDDWNGLEQYCRRVATSVGRGCLAIWAKEIGSEPSAQTIECGDACGIAFQLTNIIRDVVEDAMRGRCYLPESDLKRFGIDRSQWIEDLRLQPVRVNQRYLDMLSIYIERAAGFYEVSWDMIGALCLEGQRMFSLMWMTYRSLLAEIRSRPVSVFEKRVRVPHKVKLLLALSHFVTPLYQRQRAQAEVSRDSIRQLSFRSNRNWSRPKVAVIGGGLSGCNAAIHLARHGVDVELFEGRSRLGGRVGSFFDQASNSGVDCCQHVGMKCCSHLRRWIKETEQETDWIEQNALHFVAQSGRKTKIEALPFPAPFHLASLLWKWPDLGWGDRIQVGKALWKLYQMKPLAEYDRVLAMEWLRGCGQSDRALTRFWETILVSALGEQLNRVTLGATRKVLVDGFARTRDAFHLLVPNRLLSDLVDVSTQKRLQELGVSINCRTSVSKLERLESEWELVLTDGRKRGFDAVVAAVPWHQVERLIPSKAKETNSPSSLASSPITGVHTWWDKPWLKEPHAILVGGLCQWIFPGPVVARESSDSTYYQIVISASRDLPKGDSSAVLRAVEDDLSRAYPESQNAKLLRGKVVTDPNAVFSVDPTAAESRWRVDRFQEVNLFVAGDWTETGWPATMEGALRSGVAASECILASWGRPVNIA